MTTIVDAGSDSMAYAKLRVNTAGTKRWIRLNVAITGTVSYGATAIAGAIGGHYPVTVNALPAPDFNINTGVV